MLSPTEGQVGYALLTRSPLRLIGASSHLSPFDLHVLSTPPAFVLSQDQTLQDILELFASSFHSLLSIYIDGILVWFHKWNPHSGYVHFLRNDYLYIVQFSKIRCRYQYLSVTNGLIILSKNQHRVNSFFKIFFITSVTPNSSTASFVPPRDDLFIIWQTAITVNTFFTNF